MIVLCLDAGNTRLKWGLNKNGAWQAQGALSHADILLLTEQLPEKPQSILACNVAGPLVAVEIESLAGRLGVPLIWFRSCETEGGIVSAYENPARLGADRWAALIGVRSFHRGSALVVMAGTATTIDVLDASGVFRGGLILPGLELMHSALAQNTADLPHACGVYRDLPTNTDDAIASGALHATLGAIERMASRAASADSLLVLSGGAAGVLAPYLTLPLQCIDNLVLEGLACVATRRVW